MLYTGTSSKTVCPANIFCGTKATVKSILPQQLRLAKTQIILSNTYHLMLQPGPEIIAQEKGLQNFTQWRGPMMTDSGGYQIFSLGHGSVSEEIKGKNKNIKRKSLIKISEEGATAAFLCGWYEEVGSYEVVLVLVLRLL